MLNRIEAAELVGGNEDLKREILLRLPIKSATRFKLVSKQWLSLISDPHFVADLVRRNPNNTPKGIFFCYSLVSSPNQIDYIPFDSVQTSSCEVVPSISFLGDIYESTNIWIEQSCNGLFLCRIYPSPDPIRSSSKFCVFNPTTKQYRLLLQPRDEALYSAATLAYDPSVSLHYRVILVRRVFRDHVETCEIDVYSSECQSWKFISYGFQIPVIMDLGIGNFFNGAIHWIGREFSLSFHVYSEEMTQSQIYPEWGYRYLRDSGTHFHLVTTDRNENEDFSVHELSRDFSKWVYKYKVSVAAFPELADGINGCGIKICPYLALCLVKGDREEESALVLKMPGKLVSYNFMNKEVKTLGGLPSELGYSLTLEGMRAYPFIESLSCV